MQGLTEGRVVHYVLPEGEHIRNVGKHCPAIVVLVCPEEWGYPEGAVNLQVFVDGSNDIKDYDVVAIGGTIWATSVQYDTEGKKLGTWHWIEPA